MPTLEKYLGKVYLWRYIPSLPAGLVFAGLFLIVTIAHTWKLFKTRLWFCIPFAIGGALEVIGYITRAVATNHTGELAPYLLQAIFLLLPPVLFAASLYMVYSRVVRAVKGEPFSLLTPRWTTIIFVSGDWACLNIQSLGAGMLNKPKRRHTGEIIIVGGLGLQVIVSLLFIFVSLNFSRNFAAHLRRTGGRCEVPWKACLNMLYATSAAILVRNVFRMVEYVMGEDAYLFSHEWTTYVFDGVLMLAVMVGFFRWHPSKLNIGTTRDSMVELTSGDEVMPNVENGQERKP
ncbi:RTA1 like protein-domain-containing protein [Clohesyomyces aquaticus]|uniref:RTA1 like protein-domain-containing protein n=1 Tax=Clohesyomyces aquaticus TaxID=1231657 RepID=A0A1Y1Z5Q2_9PLEO|nr:RTA1 like protein-domain-containing protein [Clohesyomyces aquaticus]